jgi:hypothetical protein
MDRELTPEEQELVNKMADELADVIRKAMADCPDLTLDEVLLAGETVINKRRNK